MPSRASFTLIELLVVIAILAVLSTAVVLVLNPAELVKAARDTARLSDLQSIHTALNTLQADNQNASLGSAAVVSVSIPDTSATCANLGLPTLPGGYTYHCAPTSTLTKTDGTGWIPVDFTQFSGGAILSRLPLDPVNTTTTGNYYTYIPGGSWTLGTTMEATKNKLGGSQDKTSTDKGKFPSLYEVGSNLTLLPLEYSDTSLVGYWPLDEGGTATTTADASGKGNTGTLTNGPVWQESTNCKVGRCLDFDGVNDYVTTTNSSVFDITTSLTLSGWIYCSGTDSICRTGGGYGMAFLGKNNVYNLGSRETGGELKMNLVNSSGSASGCATMAIANNEWHYLTGVFESGTIKVYLDGTLKSSCVGPTILQTNGNSVTFGNALAPNYGGPGLRAFNGQLDELRIYNRALSAGEIQALYNANR